ncbi:MAG: hypothetical protein RJB24_435 [Candidatus Parcubacteria bacterium]|jgi:hypothetical protein
MIFWWRYPFIPMTTTPMTTTWKAQPGIVSETFRGVRIILARVFYEVGKWNVLIIGALDNPREIFTGNTPEEVIDQVKKILNI